MQMSTLISPSIISDGTYIAQSLAGDQYAFTQLTQRYHRQLLLFIRSRLQSVEEEEIEEEGRIPEVLISDLDLLPEAIAEYHDLQCTIDRAIDQLPSRYREIVVLRYKGQMTFTEIGHQLNIPLSTAKTSFHRARKHLCMVLKEDR
jgi:RNA polymerase sigma factor (sigma-70 family)